MDNLTYMMNLVGGYYEDERGWRHYRVQDKTYDIRFHPMTLEWNVVVLHINLKEEIKVVNI
jgi:hypothetical protein